jgi:ubiquitin-protein ligase
MEMCAFQFFILPELTNLIPKKRKTKSTLLFTQIRWRPVLTIEDILISVISMLIDPNTESPANVDASVIPSLQTSRNNSEMIFQGTRRKSDN